jgi:hypothetical protein
MALSLPHGKNLRSIFSKPIIYKWTLSPKTTHTRIKLWLGCTTKDHFCSTQFLADSSAKAEKLHQNIISPNTLEFSHSLSLSLFFLFSFFSFVFTLASRHHHDFITSLFSFSFFSFFLLSTPHLLLLPSIFSFLLQAATMEVPSLFSFLLLHFLRRFSGAGAIFSGF